MRLPWKRKQRTDFFKDWPTMIVIPEDFVKKCLESMMVCRFIHDLNQGRNGDLHLNAFLLDGAHEAIAEGVQKAIEKMNQNALEVENGKFKVWGIEFDEQHQPKERVII